MNEMSSIAQRLLYRPAYGNISLSSISNNREYKDILFVIPFFINIILILFYGLSRGIEAIQAIGYISYISISSSSNDSTTQSKTYESSSDFVGGIFLSLSLGLILSMMLVVTMTNLSYHIINVTIITTAFASLLSGIIIFTTGYIIGGLCLLLFTILCFLFYLFMRPYILFASIMLKVACLSLQQLPSLFLSTALILFFQAIFCLFWLFAVIGVATNESDTSIYVNGVTYSLNQCSTYSYSTSYTVGETTLTCSYGKSCYACICNGGAIASMSKSCSHERIYGVSYFFLILSLFWTCCVCANIVHCTVAASVSKWWSSSNQLGYQVVLTSLQRSLTYSFGSICMGSLFVALIKTLRTFVQATKYQLEKVKFTGNLLPCVQLFMISSLAYTLSAFDRLMEYFNTYAFCFVAIYGYNFVESSKAAVGLFRDRGWTAVINDDIIDYVFMVSHILIGIICTLFILAYCQSKVVSQVNSTLLLVLAYNSGHFMSSVTTKILSSAVATIYVCFAEKTELFQVSHPELYDELMQAWQSFHPNEAPTSEKIYEPSKGTYIPPHLADQTKIAYHPIFLNGDNDNTNNDNDDNSNNNNNNYSNYNRDMDIIMDIETMPPTSNPSNVKPSKTGFVISGKFGSSSTSSGSNNNNGNNSDNIHKGNNNNYRASNGNDSNMGRNQTSAATTTAAGAGMELLSKVYTGVREHTTQLVDQMALYFKQPEVTNRTPRLSSSSDEVFRGINPMIQHQQQNNNNKKNNKSKLVKEGKQSRRDEPPEIFDNVDESTLF